MNDKFATELAGVILERITDGDVTKQSALAVVRDVILAALAKPDGMEGEIARESVRVRERYISELESCLPREGQASEQECPHLQLMSTRSTGDICYEIFGYRNFDPDCQWGSIARIYTTRHDAEAAFDGMRKHTELCLKCKQSPAAKRK